jgi:prepilin-type N-terminal cleavage/methylation domain-containing protein
MKKISKAGFTLIELLIVVAIIAILAAIAVPNFLEAQTRSKVSRTLSDMRTTAVALESYYVDYNKYPRDASNGGAFLSFLPRLAQLTTPVAYVTSVFEDVFAPTAVQRNPTWGAAYKVPYNVGPPIHPYPFDFANRRKPDGTIEDPAFNSSWRNITSVSGVMWALRSVGPDNDATFLGIAGTTVYDPTNGTVSRGDIFFTGPGIGVDKSK